jgi:protein TonB
LITGSSAEYPYKARKHQITGKCFVAFTVDVNGVPQNVHVVKSLEPTLDASAIQTIENWRFKPAMKIGKEPAAFDLNNTPVPFDLTAGVDFQILDGHQTGAVIAIPERPGSPGTIIASDGSSATPPVAIKQVAPKYPFREKIRQGGGECTLKMIIDTDGIPQNVQVIKSADPALDKSAIKAVEQWRYKPATVNGVAVPAESQVIVKFQIVGRN